jgi:hypothetical protein
VGLALLPIEDWNAIRATYIVCHVKNIHNQKTDMTMLSASGYSARWLDTT